MLRYLTAGESHGRELTAIIEGMPAGLEVLSGSIDRELKRRQSGYGRGGRMKIETMSARIFSCTCWAPCQSMSNSMSRPSASAASAGSLGVP